MKKTPHTPEQVIRMLCQAEVKLAAGSSVEQVAREPGISDGHLPPLEGSPTAP